MFTFFHEKLSFDVLFFFWQDQKASYDFVEDEEDPSSKSADESVRY